MRAKRVRSRAAWRASSKVNGQTRSHARRRCRRRNARSRWRATAVRPIRFAIRSSGCARTIPASFSKASIFSMGTHPLPISATWCCALRAFPSWPQRRSKTSSFGTDRRGHRGIRTFSKSGFVTPPEFDAAQAAVYQQAAAELLAGYNEIHAKVFDHLAEKLPRPEADEPASVPTQCQSAGI